MSKSPKKTSAKVTKITAQTLPTGPDFNILIVGVGGQGVIKLGQFFQEYALCHDTIQDMIATESRGVSQREGSIYALVRYRLPAFPAGTEGVSHDTGLSTDISVSRLSPTIPLQKVHLMLALEPLEFFRNIHYLSPTARVILNTRPIIPKNILKKPELHYPKIEDLLSLVKTAYPGVEIHMKDYTKSILESAGKTISLNVFMLRDALLTYPALFKPESYSAFFDRIFPNMKS